MKHMHACTVCMSSVASCSGLSHAGMQQGSNRVHRDQEDRADTKVNHYDCFVRNIQGYRACMLWTMGCTYRYSINTCVVVRNLIWLVQGHHHPFMV